VKSQGIVQNDQFYTIWVMHVGVVVLASSFCSFFLLAKLIQGQWTLFRGQWNVRENSENLLDSDEW